MTTQHTYQVGDHVEGGDTRDGYDHGRVVEVDGDQVTVAWVRAMVTIPVPAELLRPYSAE